MKKYIKVFNKTGNSVIDTDLVCLDWGSTFSINSWVNKNGIEYTLLIKGKQKNKIIFKTQISDGQANEIINRLNLIYVKSDIFTSAASYYTDKFILSEVDRITDIKIEIQCELKEKENQLKHVDSLLKTFNDVLN